LVLSRTFSRPQFQFPPGYDLNYIKSILPPQAYRKGLILFRSGDVAGLVGLFDGMIFITLHLSLRM
jgi:hypothetical protein